MSKITLDNLSDNLKAYLEGLGLSEEQVLNLINENGLDEEELKAMLKDTMSINELNTNSKTVIGAINELFQSANNGKQLIANAIGEPVSAEDTFSAMSNDINGLLSTFKTNMMNNGVTVESSDKFKQLIDKIATLADSEGKGVKFAEGSGNWSVGSIGDNSGNHTLTIETNLDFTPTLIICYVDNIKFYTYETVDYTYNKAFLSNTKGISYDSLDISVIIRNIKPESFDIVTTGTVYGQAQSALASGITNWYAIGVGEEDTTFRDSLADILENKGVDVTEEDDMASLIGKVDNIELSPIPSWTGLSFSGQILTSTFANNFGDFDNIFKVDNNLHFVKISTTQPNWKVLNLNNGTVEDWSTYANNGITSIHANIDNGYLYSMNVNKALRFDFNKKEWTEYAINSNIGTLSYMGGQCINGVVHSMLFTSNEYIKFNHSNLNTGSETLETNTVSNVFGGFIKRYKDKILWQATTNGAVSNNALLLYDPSNNTVTHIGNVSVYVSEYAASSISTKCMFIEDDMLYYVGYNNNKTCICSRDISKNLTQSNIFEGSKLFKTISFICKINDTTLLSNEGFYVL